MKNATLTAVTLLVIFKISISRSIELIWIFPHFLNFVDLNFYRELFQSFRYQFDETLPVVSATGLGCDGLSEEMKAPFHKIIREEYNIFT